MRAANPLRGEVPLPLDGHTWCLRPSFERLVAAEGEAGSLFQMLDRAGAGDLRLADAETLLWHCLEADRPDRADFRQQLARAGIAAIMAPYRQLLARIFEGD